MGAFDTPASGKVIEIRLECISKLGGSEGLWWVAEGLEDGTTQPRGVFANVLEAEKRAEELAGHLGVPVVPRSHVD